jgi:acetyltransferase-like isoleucine patch superfamily enzyme
MSVHDWIRRRETPLQRAAYRGAKHLLSADFPAIPLVHPLLAAERSFRKGPLRHLASKLYYTPLLRRRTRECGKNLVLFEDMPKLLGNLDVRIGNRVSLSGRQVWCAAGDPTPKVLTIDDDSYIGAATEIFVGTEVSIGKHVLIANHVLLNGYDGHPLDPLARARGEGPGPGGLGAIRVGDYAWIGSKAIVLKRVTIGRGAIVATGAVVTSDVPDLAVVAGNPARVIRQLDPPTGW